MLLDILYPPSCTLCGEILGEKEGKDMLCPSCKQSYVPIQEPTCMKCGKQLVAAKEEYCFDCSRQEFSFCRNRSVFPYEGGVRRAMHRLKYQQERVNAEFFANEMVRHLGNWIRSLQVDAIIPIPLYKKRQRRRGYNQSELIAGYVGDALGIPVDTEILLRQQQTTAQKELSQKERKINVKNAFKISENDIQYYRVLLIDDIYTTGATLEAAAQSLKKAGVSEVYCATSCIGRGY